MAMTKEQRRIHRKVQESLSREIQELDSINESTDSEQKMTNLSDIGRYLDSVTLDFNGRREFRTCSEKYWDSIGVDISILLMSTKKVKVPKDQNCISLGFNFDTYRVQAFMDSSTKTTIEDFIELPIATGVENPKTAADIVALCDSNRIYNLYIDDALKIIRKVMPRPYNMFVGPNIHKKMEKKTVIGFTKDDHKPVFRDNTLYVTYDKTRKKFVFAYNPDFILMQAIDEYSLSRSKFTNFESCYKYVLAFVITHEMLHIIHHNTVVSDDAPVDDTHIDSADHEVANIVQDSFINCKIARAFSGASGITTSNREIAPMLSSGIGSRVTVRAEHNEGLKEYKDVKDLVSEIYKVFCKILKIDNLKLDFYNNFSRDISDLVGADVMITVDIKPQFGLARGNSSNSFQLLVNEIIRTITDGKVHGQYTKVSDAEKMSDLDVLPVGTLVMVKGKRIICYVHEYDEKTGLYTLEVADSTDFKKIRSGHETLYVPVYEHTGNILKQKKSRIEIKPYNPEDDAFTDESKKPQKQKLDMEDIMNALGGAPGEQPPSDGTPVKSIGIGDIVWVRSRGKFGRVKSIQNGKFELEEVVEKPVKVLDEQMI